MFYNSVSCNFIVTLHRTNHLNSGSDMAKAFKILLILCVAFVSSHFTNGQQVQQAPDFTITDTDGNTVNLYSILDEGKTVLLFFFNIDCGHCHLQAPDVDSVWQATGFGAGNVVVWGFETSTLQEVYNEDVVLFKIETGIGFPCFSNYNQEPVHQYFNVSYTPQIHIICPDKRRSEISFYEMLESIAGCGPNIITNLPAINPLTAIITDKHLLIENAGRERIKIQVFNMLGVCVFSGEVEAESQILVALPENADVFLLRSVSGGMAHVLKIVR